MRYDLTDFEWSVIEPVLPKGKPGPRRKDDRGVMNGIFWYSGRARRGAIYPTHTGHTQRLTIASTDGAKLASGID
jgi:transposase